MNEPRFTAGAPAVYRYGHPTAGWILSVATFAPAQSDKLSLGGFRIVPGEVAAELGFDPDAQAAGLATGMEGKIAWSRLVHVGGPLALRNTARLVGGKCVLLPTDDSRVGQPRDREMLDWAAECLRDLEQRAGFHVVTGQDLGHGLMSDGRTQSLDYLNARFPGSVSADTSQPTGEGNFRVLKGALTALGRDLHGASVGLIGCGHIGGYVLDRLVDAGAEVVGLEAHPQRRARLSERGVRVLPADAKDDLLSMPLDAIVVNANKRSLDGDTVSRIARNPRVRVVCGSENEAMPDEADAERLQAAGKVYFPTEFGGMMGYLTAVEQYYHQLEGTRFHVATMINAAAKLEPIAERITRTIVESGFRTSFRDAAR